MDANSRRLKQMKHNAKRKAHKAHLLRVKKLEKAKGSIEAHQKRLDALHDPVMPLAPTKRDGLVKRVFRIFNRKTGG